MVCFDMLGFISSSSELPHEHKEEVDDQVEMNDAEPMYKNAFTSPLQFLQSSVIAKENEEPHDVIYIADLDD